MYGPYRVIRNAPFPLRRFDSGTTLNLFKDGGASAPATNAPVETPGSSGVYYNLLTATEMTADHICYQGSAGDSLSDGFLIPEPCHDSGVAQAGGSSSITLRAAAPSVSLIGMKVEIVRGTGYGQAPRFITAYDTGTKVATVSPAFTINPDNTTVYIVTDCELSDIRAMDSNSTVATLIKKLYSNGVKTSTFASGSSTSLMKTGFTGLGADQVVGSAFACMGATNNGIMKSIIDYDTATGDITVAPAYASAPSAGEECWILGLTG